jgi:hypothetical protein
VKRDVIECLAHSGHNLMGKTLSGNAPAAHTRDGDLAGGSDSAKDHVAIGNFARRFNANRAPREHGGDVTTRSPCDNLHDEFVA